MMLINFSLGKKLSSGEESLEPKSSEDAPKGSVAVFEGELGECKVGVVIDYNTIQMYHKTRYGFKPEDTTEDIKNWKIVRIIED